MARILRPDPFSPILLRSRSLNVSEEQTNLIKQILDVACSDSRFAQKAYVAIGLVLTQGPAVPPVINTLSPDTIAIGDPDATLHVFGTGFSSSSKIFFNGIEEPTTFVSAGELSTGINMSVWVDPQVATVAVRNGSVESDPATFTFTEAAPEVASADAPNTPFGDTNDPGVQKPVEPVSTEPVVSPDPVINIPPGSTVKLEELEVRKPAIKTIEEPKTEQIAEKQAKEGLTPTVDKEGKPIDPSTLVKPASTTKPQVSSKGTNTFNVDPPAPTKSLDEKEK